MFLALWLLTNCCFQVVILNSTSVVLEVRFDIPFGLSPTVISENLVGSLVSLSYVELEPEMSN